MNLRWLRVVSVGLAVAVLLGTSPGVLAVSRTRASANGRQVNDPTAGVIQTLAGGSDTGAAALDSTFLQPYGASPGPDGTLYVTDTYDNQVKSINRDGHVVVVAGTGDAGFTGDGGPARSASLNFPMAVASGLDRSVYIADTWNDRVRRIDPRSGVVTTVVGSGPNDATGRSCGTGGGLATRAVISQPHGISVTGGGDLLVADTGCDVIERVSARSGTMTVIAGIEGRSGTSGDGQAVTSPLANPLSVTADSLGNAVVIDTTNRIFYINVRDRPVTLFPRAAKPRIVPAGGKVTIAAPGGNPWTAGFADDGSLLFSDTTSVHRLDWSTGAVMSAAGNGTTGEGSEHVAAGGTPLSYPSAVFGDGHGGFIVVDRGNSRLRQVDARHLETTIAGRPNAHGPALGDGGPRNRAVLDQPSAVAAGNRGLYVSDPYDRRIRRINPDGSIISVVSDGPPCVRLGLAVADCPLGPADRGTGIAVSNADLLAYSHGGQVFVLNDSGRPQRGFGASLQPGAAAPITKDGTLQQPVGLTFTSAGDLVVADRLANQIDRIDARTGAISVLAGAPYPASSPITWRDGPGAGARFDQPSGVAATSDGTVYVADTGNNRIRRIDTRRGSVTTVAGTGMAGFRGDGGPGLLADLAYPSDVTVGPDGSVLILDWGNERIRRIDHSGVIRTYAGSGPGRTGRSCGSTVPCGHYAGDGELGPSAQLNFGLDAPSFETLGPDGRLYVADTMNNRVRVIALRG